ncbi:hypothetical protein A3K01_03975 [candidate division WWE3 bacterium RIFOXYD1_FULL_43_17]|uniref:Cadherin domain-containing protein n=2 Tax=Katanobacteria TaxID=422282 RepID=A0A1F4XDV5_UNCKA|nr:MAG: VCBS repeat-containing protein [candidate division TM6 bacterium GW2011_GWF2_33_332]KKS03234.1 MAG: VCBS repeat-containing protein [candidate division WWE3 bacterium GW2011_GWC2_41_23]OGC79856.1 MAG: hypothetical protein A3K01_03975 [candidate division WWE3 bacterium RIFOXYD1_FULL_43_17]
MKIKHKKIAHRLLNQFVIFSLIFQNFYPILYFTPVFAQTSNTILELSGDQEFTPPEQLEAITGSDPNSEAVEAVPTESLLDSEPGVLPSDSDEQPEPVGEVTYSDSLEILSPGSEPTALELTEDTLSPQETTVSEQGPNEIPNDTDEIIPIEVLPDETIMSELTGETSENSEVTRDPTIEQNTAVQSDDEMLRLNQRHGEKKSKEENRDLFNRVPSENLEYMPGEVLVKYRDSEIDLERTLGRAKASVFALTKKLEKVKESRSGNISLLRIKDNKSVEDKIKELREDKRVEYAEPNYLRYPQTINSNDTYKQNLWGLDNTGQTVNNVIGTLDSDIDAPEAWLVDEGSTDVIVAVIDSGVAYNHPDLVGNMWDGSNCKDISGNNLGGCLHGYDFEDNDKDPQPTDSIHGTYSAGIIAASRNNNQGILGVTLRAKIMALKHGFDVASEVMAIDFAIQNGAKVINASFAGTAYSQAEYDAINRFLNYGGIFIAAAGNEASNNDYTHAYPSDLNLNNIISVASTDQNDGLSNFSNYSSTFVDVGAPGENIYSTSLSFNDSTVLDEDFESVIIPFIPSGWTEDGTFATIDYSDIWGPGWKVLYGDLEYPYSENNNSKITTSTVNLDGASDVAIGFYTECDTEYPLDGWHDYMVVEASSDGTNFSEVDLGWGEGKYDEPMIDILNGDELDDGGYASAYMTASIASDFYTSNFKLRFRWVTDSDSDKGTYGDGCLIDDIVLLKRAAGSYEYEFVDGTSFAAPYTAGLAALLWSIDSSLTYDEVKNAILNTGDTKPSLVGKTVTGKRINAYNAVRSLNGSKDIVSFNFNSLGITGIINENEHTISLVVPYGTNISSLLPTITHTGEMVSPPSEVAQDFSSPVTYTVTAVNSTTQDYVVTVTVESPSTIATVSSGVYTVELDTISNVPFNTSEATFLAALTKDEPNQTWSDTNLNDPILTGNELIVTAQDGTTSKTYTINVNEVLPVLDPIGNKTVDELTQLTFTASATDPDGPSTTYYLTDEPSGASINPTSGVFTFTPTESQGPDNYYMTVSVTDGSNIDYEDITITVNEVNVVPVSYGVSDSLDEDDSKAITLNATDTDEPANSLSYSIVVGASHGNLGTVSGNQVLYTPNENYNGPDSFTYKANDGNADSNTATVSISVNSVNDAPTANSQSISIDEDTEVLVTLTGNDIDEDSLSFNLIDAPTHGSLEIISGTQVNYVPNTDYVGGDSFTFKASDGFLDSNTATVSITVGAINDTPILDAIGNKIIDELDTLTFTASAADPDSSLTYSLINAPTGASIGSTSGFFTFTPTESQGPNSYNLTVSVTDGNTSDTEDITITVNEVNVVPVVNDFSVSTDEDRSKDITLNVTDPDLPGNTFSYILGTSPTHGSLGPISSGQTTYTPNSEYNGSDSFTYKVNDGSADSDFATVSITVDSINDAPSINTTAPNSATEDTLYTYDADETDVDGPSAVWTKSASDTCNGSLDSSSGVYTFTPVGPTPISTCEVSVTISDYGSPNLSDTQTTTVTVTAVNDLPISTGDDYSTDEDSVLNVTAPGILSNDSDPENSSISTALVSDVTNGDLSLNNNGSFSYAPNTNYYGIDTFVYKISDGTDYSENATVTITVDPINDAPTANSDSASTDEDTQLILTKDEVLTNDTDVDDDHSLLNVQSVSKPINGTVYIDGANIVFTPSTDYFGSASFEYTVSDGYLTNSATVNITVNSINDAPSIDSTAPITATEDILYTYDAEVTDPDGPSASWSKTELDTCNGSLDTNTGYYSFTPNGPVPSASCVLSIKVEDGADPSFSATENVTVNIVAVNDAPTAYGTTAETDEDNSVDIGLNGTDPEDDILTFIVSTVPVHGNVDIDGNVATYTPNPGYNGSDSFEFVVNDGSVDSNDALVSLTITGINDAPVIESIPNQTIDEYYNLQITPVVTDVDGGAPSYSLTNSSVDNSSINTETGEFNFTPDESQGGSVFDFTIQVDDGFEINNIATESFSVTVNEINNSPIATDDNLDVNEDSTLLVNHAYLLSNDTDPDNTTDDFSILSVSNVTPTGSVLTFNSSTIEFTPPENFNGQATYEYLISDGSLTDTGLVTITVNSINDAPVAYDDSSSTDEDSALVITKASLLANDEDVDEDSLSLSIVFDPVNGTVEIDGDNVVFTPSSNYNGSASFSYTVTDGELTDTASVSITINPINDAPVLNTVGDKTIDEFNELNFTATAVEVDTEDVLSFSLSNAPTGASINSSTGEFSFTPVESQGSNTYNVDINVTDGLDSDVETITVTVNEVNVASVVNELWATTNEDTAKVITLEGNDTDIPTQTLNYSVTDPSHGLVSIAGDQVTYTADTNYYGDDAFTYKANDGVTDSSSETVHITVNAINDGPDANPDSASGNEDEDTIIAESGLLTNDTDVDDVTLTLSNVSTPVNGSVAIDGDNVVFTPDSNFNGTAYFDYTVSDGELTDKATVTVTINPINDAPVANLGTASAEEDGVVTITLTGSDVDGDSISYIIVDNPSNGSLGSIVGSQVDYSPNENYEGNDSFTFKVNDGLLDSNIATIDITVTEFNDPPVLDEIGNKSVDELTELTFTATATDPDSSLTYYLSDEPTGATIDTNSGYFSFTPSESQGPQEYTFDVNVTDGVSIDTEIITVTVNEINVAPLVNDVNAATSEDLEKIITLNATDSDIPTQSITYAKVTDPSNGTISILNDSATYTPNANFYGDDSFTYKANDGETDSNTATVFITVTAFNDAPVANPDSASVDEDNTLSVSKETLIENDTDVDDISLVLSSISNPVNGLVSIDGSNVIFTPTSNYFGSASFDYTVSDGSLTDTTTVLVTVNPINDAPSVNDGTAVTDEDNSVSIYLVGTDIEGDSLSYTIIDSTSNGALGGPYGNQVIYTPNENYFGGDSFTFKVDDGNFESNTGTVTITINAINDLPALDVIGDKSIDELAELSFTVTANDSDTSDALELSLTNAPTGASIESDTGNFSFTPTEVQGPNTYNVTVNVTDGIYTDSEEIEITVNEVNTSPVAQDVNTSTNEDVSKSIILNASDADIPANTLTYTVETGANHGTLGTISGNELTYTPDTNYNGVDTFTYKVNDGLADSNIVTVNITVNSVNDAPEANQDNASFDEDTQLILAKNDLITNDTDVDLDTLSVIGVSTPTHGTVYIDGSNIIFTPVNNYNGAASFEYTLSDGTLTDTGFVNLTINPVNDAPTVSADAYSTTQEAAISITLLGNDIENDPLVYSINSDPTNGSLSTVSGNQVTYTPDTGYIGNDSFTYQTNDGEYDSNEATIDITVLPPPVISGESSTNLESTSITITWTTDHLSTSRVIYDTASHPTLGTAPNYGYAYSTIETDGSPMVISHNVTISPLTAETTYYYRAVSHGSPEVVGDELSFTTKKAVEEDTEAPDRPENVGVGYDSDDKTIKLTWENNDSDIDKVFVYLGYSESFDKNSDSRIAENDRDDEDVTVNDVKEGKTYYFKLVSEDGAGNRSNTKTISIEIPSTQEKVIINTYESPTTLAATDEVLESGDETKNVLGLEDVEKDNPSVVEETRKSNIWRYIIPSLVVLSIGTIIILRRKRK